MVMEDTVFTQVFLIEWIIKLTIEGEDGQIRQVKEH